MPNPGADAPLRKVTLNLYESDCEFLEQKHGQGWTTRIREFVHNHVLHMYPSPWKITVGDLDE